MRKIKEFFGKIGDFFSDVADWFVSVWDAIVAFFVNLWDVVTTFFINLWDAVTGFFIDVWYKVVAVFNFVVNIFKIVVAAAIGFVAEVLAGWSAECTALKEAWFGKTVIQVVKRNSK